MCWHNTPLKGCTCDCNYCLYVKEHGVPPVEKYEDPPSPKWEAWKKMDALPWYAREEAIKEYRRIEG